MSTRRLLNLGVLALTFGFAVSTVFAASLVLRGPLSLAFLLFAPGWAVVGHLRLGWSVLGAGLAVATSIALSSVVATVALWTGTWHPDGIAVALAILVTASLVLQLRAQRSARV